MTTTEIKVRAFCSDFTLKLKAKGPVTLKGAIKHVIEVLEWDTAVVKSITHADGTVIENKAQA